MVQKEAGSRISDNFCRGSLTTLPHVELHFMVRVMEANQTQRGGIKEELKFWTCMPSNFTFLHLSHLSISSLFLRNSLLRTLQLDAVIEHDRHCYRWLNTWKSSIAVMVNNNHRFFLSSLKEMATLHWQLCELERPKSLQSSL